MKRVGLGFLGDAPTEEMLSHIKLAEAIGFESVWMSETRFVKDAFTMLGAFSQVTTRMGLATAVINPFTRHPVLTAVSLATLDHLSKGRAIFGIGAGSPLILRRQGIKLEQPIVRVRETVEVIERLLAGEAVTYRGSHAPADGVRLDVKPIRRRVPVYIGATGPRMLQLAGKISDGVILNSPTSPNYLQRASAMVLREAESEGRRAIDVAACIECAVSDRSEEAKDLVRPVVTKYLAYFPAIAKESNVEESLLEEIKSTVMTKGVDRALSLVNDDIVDSITAAGTEDEFLSKLETYFNAGVMLPVLFPHGSKQQVDKAIKACGGLLLQ
jgi:5,10-methylenetetrahydromethanopterin reductase